MFYTERIKRFFYWSKKAVFTQKRTLFSLPRIWIQLLYYRLRNEISAEIYVSYRFWENSHEKVRHHFTNKDNVYLVETVNDQSKIPQSQAKFQSKSRTFFHSCKTKNIRTYLLPS